MIKSFIVEGKVILNLDDHDYYFQFMRKESHCIRIPILLDDEAATYCNSQDTAYAVVFIRDEKYEFVDFYRVKRELGHQFERFYDTQC